MALWHETDTPTTRDAWVDEVTGILEDRANIYDGTHDESDGWEARPSAGAQLMLAGVYIGLGLLVGWIIAHWGGALVAGWVVS